MSSVTAILQKEFYSTHVHRQRDGEMLGVYDVTTLTSSRLKGESEVNRRVVITEKALYEFKATAISGSEYKRILIEDVCVLFKIFEIEKRVVLGLSNNAAVVYQVFLVAQFVKDLCTAYQSATGGEEMRVMELQDRHVLILMNKAKKITTPDCWDGLLAARKSETFTTGTGVSENDKKTKKSTLKSGTTSPSNLMKSASASPLSGNSPVRSPQGSALGLEDSSSARSGDSGSGKLPGRLGGKLGPMTLLWRRLEHSLKPHMQMKVFDDENFNPSGIVRKVNQIIQNPDGENPFEALPKSCDEAARALAAVLMEKDLCNVLAHCLGKERGPPFLVSMEGLLGCSQEVTRRWIAFGLISALPVFAALNFLPEIPSWQRATVEYMTQEKRRENVVVSILFLSKAVDVGLEGGDEGEGSNGVLLNAAELKKLETLDPSQKISNKDIKLAAQKDTNRMSVKRPPQLITVSKSVKINGTNQDAARNFIPTLEDGVSTASLTSTASASKAYTSEVYFAGEAGVRRLNGVFASLWLGRLLDLENGVEDGSVRDSGGIMLSDLLTFFEIILNRFPDPALEESNFPSVETFGAQPERPEFLPALMGAITATRSDEARRDSLKLLNVMLIKNVSAVKGFLSVIDWQSVLFTPLIDVPFAPTDRNQHQEEALSYCMHLLTTLHSTVLGAQFNENGPLDKLLSHTIFKMAVYAGWGEPAIHATRSLFKAVLSVIQKSLVGVAAPFWKNEPKNEEWEELFRVTHLLQTFLFYRPESLGYKDMPDQVEDVVKAARVFSGSRPSAAMSEASSADGGIMNVHGEWRTRIKFVPFLTHATGNRITAIHKQVYSRLNLPVMAGGYRGEEMGVHLNNDGTCADRALVEQAVKLWNCLGVTGEEKKDVAKSEEFTQKNERSRIMYASKLTRELLDVLHLFDAIDEKQKHLPSSPAGKKKPHHASHHKEQVTLIALNRVAQFLEKQKRNDATVGFMSKGQSKNVAMKLKANMLKQGTQQVGVRRKVSVEREVELNKPSIANAPASKGRLGDKGSATRKGDNFVVQMKGDTIVAPPAQQQVFAHAHVNDKGEEKTVFELVSVEEESDLGGRKTRATQARKTNVVDAGTQGRKTLVKLEDKVAFTKTVNFVGGDMSGERGSVIRREVAPVCHGCDKIIKDEVQEILKFGQYWHVECLCCSCCGKNVISNANFGDTKAEVFGEGKHLYQKDESFLSTCRYYPLSELLLCSNECRKKALTRPGDARCPGCMDGFDAKEIAFQACGFSWHIDLGCFRCVMCDLRLDDKSYYKEKDEPYCKRCFFENFLKCKCCNLPLTKTQEVIEGHNGNQFHLKCFCCSVCKTPFDADGHYFSNGSTLYCLAHFMQHRSPPCNTCNLPLVTADNWTQKLDDSLVIGNLAFHRHCFNCSKCSRKLNPEAARDADDEARENHGSVYCAKCYAEDFGVKCTKCAQAIRGDILHAGVDNTGDALNWHPACFNCDECAKSLVDLQFYVVRVGEENPLPVCFEHYQSRYGNSKCPGCANAVKPREKHVVNDVRGDESNPIVRAAKEGQRKEKEMFDSNPTVIYDGDMWHASCLNCDEAGCDVSLYLEEENKAKFRMHVFDGKKYCKVHLEVHAPHCKTCDKAIPDDESRVELMDWLFHDLDDCVVCCVCKEPLEDGQALKKKSEGPAHVECPKLTRSKSIFSSVSSGLRKTFSKKGGAAPVEAETLDKVAKRKQSVYDPTKKKEEGGGSEKPPTF